MRILVTGGAGFIGSAIVRRLVCTEGATVITADALTYAGNLDSLDAALNHPKHRFEHVDVCNPAEVRRLLDTYEPDAVVHLAAESHVDRSIDGPAPFIRTNLLGTFTLLEEVRGYLDRSSAAMRDGFRLLHVSTDEVFGSLGPEGHFTERSGYAPNSPYSASKAGADHLIRAWTHTYGVPAIVTNCSNNYGPYQFPEKLIPLTILNAIGGKPLPVYGRGENVRDWLFVDDHIDALLTVLRSGRVGEAYLIGGNEERRNIEIVRQVCALLDELHPSPHGSHERLIRFVEDRPGHDARYAIDATKLRTELGWAPRETFPTGLHRTVRWYLEHGTWCERILSGRYRGERLGLAARTLERGA